MFSSEIMEYFDAYPERINTIETDFRAEVAAAELYEKLGDLSHFVIRRTSHNHRPYNKDITSLYQDQSDYDLKQLYVFETFREGIYDNLPENLFHPPTLGGVGKDEEEIVEEIKRQRQVEEDTRRFFLPFEQEISYLYILSAYYENTVDKKGQYNSLLDIFRQGWDIFSQMHEETAKVFLYIIPVLHLVRGRNDWIQKCLTWITGLPIQITEDHSGQDDNARYGAGFEFGQNSLGVDTVMGGAVCGGDIDFLVTIGPVPPERTKQFIPGSSYNKLLEKLYSFLFPFQISVKQNIVTLRDENFFVLDEKHETRLGLSVYL